MKCDIIQDLIPLYADSCCSAESARLVEEHIKSCGACRSCLENARKPLVLSEAVSVPKVSRISAWKASILQSILFLLYFTVITVGVALEARSTSGPANGVWAFRLVVPATGFLLSLVNWYFIQFYRSRRAFVIGSFVCTVVLSLCCVLIGVFHYGVPLWNCLRGAAFFGINLILSAVLSGRYAKMVGKG